MTFAVDLERFAREASKRGEAFVREATFRVTNEIIEATPADTGALRRNWQATVDKPASSRLPAAATAEQSTAQAFAAAKQAIAQSPGRLFFLTNNLPYAAVVEFGLYPNPPKRGTYLPSGKTKRGRSGPGFFQFSKGGFSDIAPRGMARITVKKVAAALR